MNRRNLLQSLFGLPWIAGGVLRAQTHDHSAMSVSEGQFNPWVVSDGNGGFYLAYVQRKDSHSDVQLQRSTSNGQFSPGIRVNDKPGDAAVRNENPPKVAVGPRGEIYVAWANERERWKGNIRFARSLDGGKSFEPSISVNSGAEGAATGRAFQSILVDSAGRIFVAWIDERNKTSEDRGAEIWMAVSENGGKTFSQDRKIVSDVCECCRLTLATDRTGAIYLSYRMAPRSGPMFRDIAVARSIDQGRTFRSRIVHQDRWELNACPVAGATMTIDPSGQAHVVWFTQAGDKPKVYLASSRDQDLSFGAPIDFDPNQMMAKHAYAIGLGEGRVFLAWDDLNEVSVVKWGLYTPASPAVRLMGTIKGASYPVMARSGKQICLVALQSERPEILRRIQSVSTL